jgi:Domain of unknown function (DUF2383)
MSNDKKALKAVHDLIATCNDAAEGFAKAAKGVHDSDLSNWLAAASADRERFAADLTQALKEMGEHSKDDKEIIRECITGDSGSLRHYDYALAQDLTPHLRSLILEQRAAGQGQLVYLQNRVGRQQSQTA